MKKLEEILETKLPLHINRNVDISNNLIEIPKSKIRNREEFLKFWVYGDRYSMIDYPDIFERFENSGIDKYCLSTKEGKPTLSISEAYQETPNLKIPFIEMDISNSSGIPVAIFLTISENDLVVYIPRCGNTIRMDTNKDMDDSGIFDFDWKDKNVLEKSDLLYIVKDVNRSVLSKYTLEEIYRAFQEYKETGSESIVDIDRQSCIYEFEKNIHIK